MPPEIAPNGSRFYVWGHHWRVESQCERDGEPAVRVTCLTGKRKRKGSHVFSVRLLDKYGHRNDRND